jgi:hypothetical protein
VSERGGPKLAALLGSSAKFFETGNDDVLAMHFGPAIPTNDRF